MRYKGLFDCSLLSQTRPLGIPTVSDRIAQMVVQRYLEPIVEPLFHDDSYGYRPGRSAHRHASVCLPDAPAAGNVFCIAAYLLYRALSAYQPAKIVEAIFAIPRSRLALGALFVVGSYFSLTLFDALAIRYIGAKLPYRRIALASFTALSIGHTLGVAAASSGAIRYRFYSRWGIGAGDIARIILFCAMTAGLGLNTLMGLALLLQANVAAKLLGFSQAGAIALGGACLLLTALYVALAAVLHQPLAISRWEIPIPPVKLALAQLSVGTMDFCFVAAALYELLPATVGVGYFAVATVYVLANAATIISHVPGGLGVLEAVVIHVLPEVSVIGALVVFRFIYFLVPLTIGAALFTACELTQRRRRGAFHS